MLLTKTFGMLFKLAVALCAQMTEYRRNIVSICLIMEQPDALEGLNAFAEKLRTYLELGKHSITTSKKKFFMK